MLRRRHRACIAPENRQVSWVPHVHTTREVVKRLGSFFPRVESDINCCFSWLHPLGRQGQSSPAGISTTISTVGARLSTPICAGVKRLSNRSKTTKGDPLLIFGEMTTVLRILALEQIVNHTILLNMLLASGFYRRAGMFCQTSLNQWADTRQQIWLDADLAIHARSVLAEGRRNFNN